MSPEEADLARRRALHELQLMLGTHIYDLPKLIAILEGRHP